VYRLSVLYGVPTDPRAFDAYYRKFHIPIAARMKGLTRWTITPILQPTDGTTVPYHMIADLYAPSQEQMQAILDSPEGRAAREDLDNFVTGGATFLNGFEEVIDLP